MAHADDDPLKWSWRCAVSGFYEMEVHPDGTVKPTTDYSDRTPIEIIIKEAGQNTQEYCVWDKYPIHYYVEIKGNQLAARYSIGSCDQSVQIDTKLTHVGNQSFQALEQVESVTTHYRPMSLLVHRDDADWRFVLSSTDLTTVRESRQLRATFPQPQITFDPKASTWFLTGECVMTAGQ
jgi:hypothetical protein